MKHHRRSIHRWAFAFALAFFGSNRIDVSLWRRAARSFVQLMCGTPVPKQSLARKFCRRFARRLASPSSDDVVEQDIRNLYKTGQLQNVRIFGEPSGGGVKVTVVVQTRSIVTEIEINGAHGFTAKRVRSEIKIKMNTPVSEDALTEARQKIIDLYRRFGYNDVGVEYHLDVNETHGTSRAIFTINEGEKGTVSRVQFEGNNAFSDRTLRQKMKTKGKTLVSFLDKSGRLDETQFQEDLDKIREWYQNHGYIDVEIKDVRKERP